MKTYIIIFLAVFLLIGCREEVVFDLPVEDPQLVIEAELTDTEGPHTVRLSLTQDYFSDAPPPPVTEALVIISDNKGHADTLEQIEPGLYVTDSLEGVIGRSYTLHIEWNGNVYEDTGTLLEEAVIDSLNYRYFEANPIFEEGYYIFFFGRLPADRNNYFRFKVYENDSLYNDRTDFLLQNNSEPPVPDTLANIRFSYPFGNSDTVRIEMYTLEKEMYQYYLELVTLLFNDGGLFSPPPQNPVSTITNLTDPDNPPLGYFQVASVTTGTIIIREEEEE
ncbi:DUF4249 domain-containing protein [Nafulsella turpanensis]|uniref:DUF4249 domain-containing protein n=1 Tax=Nafulsella turpanensis TaxID=1265690 RepID=UPI000348D66D|nr:DUF4249 domain-containing protein [Nafulsella turpanensis]